uniref:Tail spike protein n=2 Tax=Enterobacteria phage HK620 TaxID=155148 RepID=UPI000745F256|nr:Chain A, Tail spike protein [Enterobacteria phage HK620]
PDQFRAIIESPEGAGHVGYQYRRNTGSTMRMVSDVLDERVSLWDFHCDPSGNVIQPGPNVDSRQYLQAAIDYVSSNGGGTITIPAGYTWYLGSYGVGGIAGHSGIIQLRSNVNLNIEGRIHLSPFFDLKPFQVFVGFDNGDPASSGNLENCHIYGHGVVDFGGYEFGASSQLRNGVAFGRSYNCSVTGITFQNGDVTWAITLGWNGYGSNCYVRKCRFINLVNSSVNAAHSTVYVNCPYSGVESCYFSMSSSFARNIACSVQLHQHDTFYRGSTVNGYCRGAYVVMHAAEAAGAGSYAYNMQVENNIAVIYGQFVILGSDVTATVSGHLNDVIVSGNIVSIGERAAFSAPFGAFIDIGPDNSGASNVQDIQRVLVTGNSFYAPANITDSAAITLRANLNGCTFIANNFDCRYMVYNAPGTTSPVVQNLVWDKSNVIGGTHANQRAGQNLFDMQFASVVNSTIEVQLSCEDLSMFSCILFPASCQLSYSKITVDSAWTKSMSNTAVFEGNQQAGANVYVSYPATVNLTSYNTQGAVPFFSTDTNYAWVTSAYSLSINENLDFSPPATYTNKANGQLVGVGYNEIGGVRSVSVRLMLQRQV